MPDRESPQVSKGRLIVKVVPFPVFEETSMVPSCSEMIAWVMASPSPCPPLSALVVKERWKMWGRSSFAMPHPVSETVM